MFCLFAPWASTQHALFAAVQELTQHATFAAVSEYSSSMLLLQVSVSTPIEEGVDFYTAKSTTAGFPSKTQRVLCHVIMRPSPCSRTIGLDCFRKQCLRTHLFVREPPVCMLSVSPHLPKSSRVMGSYVHAVKQYRAVAKARTSGEAPEEVSGLTTVRRQGRKRALEALGFLLRSLAGEGLSIRFHCHNLYIP